MAAPAAPPPATWSRRRWRSAAGGHGLDRAAAGALRGGVGGVPRVGGLPVVEARHREGHRVRGWHAPLRDGDGPRAGHQGAAGVVREDAVGDRSPGDRGVGPAQGGRVGDVGARGDADGGARDPSARERVREAGDGLAGGHRLDLAAAGALRGGVERRITRIGGLPVVGARYREGHRIRGWDAPLRRRRRSPRRPPRCCRCRPSRCCR